MQLIREYNLEPKKIEEHIVLGKDWRWKSPVQVRIDSKTKEAEWAFEEVVKNPDWVVVCTDGSLLEEGVGGAAVLMENGAVQDTRQYHLGPANHHTVFEAELVGLILAIWMGVSSCGLLTEPELNRTVRRR